MRSCRRHVETDRWSLAWTILVLRALYVLPIFLMGRGTPTLRGIAGVRQIPFLAEPAALFSGASRPFSSSSVSSACSSSSRVRRGCQCRRLAARRTPEALVVSGGVVFFLSSGSGAPCSDLGQRSRADNHRRSSGDGRGDGIRVEPRRASRDTIVDEFSGARRGCARAKRGWASRSRPAGLGISIRDLVRDEIWASDKWRTLFGFAPSGRMNFAAVLGRVDTDDRERSIRSQAMALAGATAAGTTTEFRVIHPDGCRWIARGAGSMRRDRRPVLMRGAPTSPRASTPSRRRCA